MRSRITLMNGARSSNAFSGTGVSICSRVTTAGNVNGVLPLVQLNSRLFGNFFVSIPCFNYCGTLTSSEAVRSELISAAWKLARESGASHVELRHRARINADLPYRDDKVAMQLALPESSDELWQQFSSKLRAQIRRPTKEGATSEEGGVELLDDFYAVFSRNMRDLGTPVFPKDLFREMCDSFPDTTRIFIVRIDGKPCAAGITYGFRERLEIPSASSLREYNRSLCQHASLLDRAAIRDSPGLQAVRFWAIDGECRHLSIQEAVGCRARTTALALLFAAGGENAMR